MKLSVSRPPMRIIVAMLLAMAVLFASGSPLAFAGRAICRSDPIVVLSNGDIIDLYADIETDLSNLASVDYVLHGPSNVRVVAFLHPNPLTAPVESFTYVADGGSKKYTATTVVQIVEGKAVKVTAYADLVALGVLKVRTEQMVGLSGAVISVDIKR